MTASERETAGTVRSAHVAHFLPPDWTRVARIAAPALERITRDSPTLQVLIVVPDGAAALALARAIAAVPANAALRVVAATSGARGRRLLAGAPAHVVIGAPSALAPLVAASALKLDQVTAIVLASADELDADDPELSSLLTEVPRAAARVLTALDSSAGVELLLERHLHKARHMTDEDAPALEAAGGTLVRYLAVAGSPVDALPGVLDEVDAPSAAIVAPDAATAAAARALLSAIGYPPGALAHVTEGDVAANTALVVLLGVPTASVWSRVAAAQPAQVVAVIAARERAALRRLAGDAWVQPFATRGALLRARAAEARSRAELREVLGAGIPVREVLALEPLLGEYDGLEIGAAALRLLEATRAAHAEALAAAVHRTPPITAEVATDRGEPAGPRMERHTPPRGFGPRSEQGDRGDRGSERGGRSDRPRAFGARSDKPTGYRDRGDKPTGFRDRGDKPTGFRDRGEKPTGFRDRGEKPTGYRDRGDKPTGFGPRREKPKPFGTRGDKPRGPRRDDDGRGPRGPRTPR